MKQVITKQEVDWATEYGVYAINRDTRLVENTSGVTGITVEIFYGLDYDYALYDGSLHLVGFAYFSE